jgi:hypothetical protein
MKRPDAVLSALSVMCAVAATSCAAAQPRSVADRSNVEIASTLPVIDSVRPDSVSLPYGGVAEVTIFGKGFLPGDPGRNRVHFDRATINAIRASSDGNRIVFAVPDQLASGGEAPPRRLQPGRYDVGVETAAGLSNLVSMRVYR